MKGGAGECQGTASVVYRQFLCCHSINLQEIFRRLSVCYHRVIDLFKAAIAILLRPAGHCIYCCPRGCRSRLRRRRKDVPETNSHFKAGGLYFNQPH